MNNLLIPNYGNFLCTPIKVLVTDAYGITKPFSNDYEDNCRLYGYSLIDILLRESEIKLNKNNSELIFSRIFTDNPHADATRLIGSIAEILVTKFCKEHQEVNRRLGMYARGASRLSREMDNFIAIATGAQQTRQSYPVWYNPSDTQRDIIWVKKDDLDSQLLCVKSRGNAGKPAGLQVKTSHNYQYVLNSIEKYHYPVLYFDLNNDWWQLDNVLKNSDFKGVLVQHDDITNEIKRILVKYFNIVIKIFSGEMNLQYLIDMSKYEGMTDILKGLELANQDNDKKIIIS